MFKEERKIVQPHRHSPTCATCAININVNFKDIYLILFILNKNKTPGYKNTQL